MKAIIKETGETVEGFKHFNEKGIVTTFITLDGMKIPIEEVDFVTVSWEQRRYEIAKAAMQGLLANPEALNHNVVERYRATFQADVAHSAVKYADALIEELKKK